MKNIKILLCFFFLSLLLVLTSCGKGESQEVHNHEFSEWIIVEQATCTTKGTTKRTCSCGEEESGIIDALGHDLKYVRKEDATCTVGGYEAYEYCQKCSYTTYVEIKPKGHNLVKVEKLEATCLTDGHEAYEYCTDCSYSTFKEIKACGHEIIKVDALNPTCTSVGHKAYEYCKNCEYTTYEAIPALEHSLTYVGQLDPTCEEDGHEAYEYCENCSYSTYQAIPATGHNLLPWVMQYSPTCLETGLNTANCQDCSHVEQEVIPALGHSLEYFDAVEPTCIASGNNAYEACSVCSYTTYEEIPALGHKMNGNSCQNCDFVLGVTIQHGNNSFYLLNGALVSDNYDCHSTTAILVLEFLADGIISFDYSVSSESGWDKFLVLLNYNTQLEASGEKSGSFTLSVKAGDVVDFKYQKDGSGSYGADCAQIYNLKYSFVSQEATCLSDGAKLSYNIVTGKTEVETIEALGHDIIEHEGHAPTCTEGGYLAYETCSRCSYSTFEVIGEPTGHNLHTAEAKEPTCEGIGWEEYQYCISCSYTEYVEIPAKGHTYGEWDEQVIPTCTTEGYRERFCEDCGDYNYEYPQALGHDYQGTIIEATCEDNGYTHYECSRCEESYDGNYTYALGHDIWYYYGQWATCTQPGFNDYEECVREGCGYTTYKETSPALGHSLYYDEGLAPTCESDGYAPYEYCENCGYSTYEYLDALGHDYGEWETVSEATCTMPAILEKHCSRCEEYDMDYDMSRPALGHEFGDEVVVEATETTQGYKYKECGVCEYVDKYDFTETAITSLFVFKEYGSGYQIIGTNLTEDHTVVEIPSEYNGKPVVSIKGSASSSQTAFYGCDFIKVLIIPETVTNIGKNALSGLWNLEELTVPASAASYLAYMFDDRRYSNYDDSTFPSTLTKVTLTGNGSLGSKYFSRNDSSYNNINTIILEEGITSIGTNAFTTCYNLTYLSIPSTMESIAEDAFKYCSTDIYNYYENGKYLGNEENNYLWLVEMSDKTLSTYTINENTTIIGTKAFANCTNLTEISIPKNIVTIGSYAFSGCSKLESIVIPDTVVSLGSNAFGGCIALKDVHIGSGITELIGTFAGCSSLVEIVIPDNITYISGGTFFECSSLESIYIPLSVVKFGDSFDMCNALTNVYYGGTFEDWQNIDYSNASNYMGMSHYKADPMYYAENLYITNESGEYELVTEIHVAEDVETLDEYTYYGLDCVTTVYLPSTIKNINSDAFFDCNGIKVVYMPLIENFEVADTFPKVEKIVFTNDFEVLPANYFEYTYSLKEVVLPEGLKTISDYAFHQCNLLEKVMIPNSVTTIGEYAFCGCCKLAEITIPSGVTVLENSVFCNTGIKELIIPETVLEIKYYAFGYCLNLVKVVIPTELTNIEEGAFAQSVNIKNITMPAIGDKIGYIWNYNYSSSYAPSNMDRVTLNGEEIPASYLSSIYLTELVISDTVTKVGNWILNSWDKPDAIYYLGTLEQWNAIEFGYNTDLLEQTIYLYTVGCIHEKESIYWTYDDAGNPSRLATVDTWNIVTPATCSQEGLKEGHCRYCNELLTESLPMLAHTFVGTECSSCGLALYSVTTGSYTFVDSGNGTFQSNNYHKNKTTATYIITANVAITISFQYQVSSEKNCDYLNIYANGNLVASRAGKDEWFWDKTVTLQAGEELKFEYVKDAGTHSGNDRAYFIIDSITIVG